MSDDKKKYNRTDRQPDRAASKEKKLPEKIRKKKYFFVYDRILRVRKKGDPNEG